MPTMLRYMLEKIAIDEALEKALATPIEKKVADMMANSHEYKKPNIQGALTFVKNYTWEERTIPLSRLQGINKPIKKDKVFEIAKTLEKNGDTVEWPFIVVNKLHGIRPQTHGKVVLMDGHHRMEACKARGIKEVPVYFGTYTGGVEIEDEELYKEVPNEKTAASLEDYMDPDRKFRRDRLAMDIKYRKLKKDDLSTVLDEAEHLLQKSRPIEDSADSFLTLDRKKWNKDYLDRTSYAAVGERYDRPYYEHLADVANHLRKKKIMKGTAIGTGLSLGALGAGLGTHNYIVKKKQNESNEKTAADYSSFYNEILNDPDLYSDVDDFVGDDDDKERFKEIITDEALYNAIRDKRDQYVKDNIGDEFSSKAVADRLSARKKELGPARVASNIGLIGGIGTLLASAEAKNLGKKGRTAGLLAGSTLTLGSGAAKGWLEDKPSEELSRARRERESMLESEWMSDNKDIYDYNALDLSKKYSPKGTLFSESEIRKTAADYSERLKKLRARKDPDNLNGPKTPEELQSWMQENISYSDFDRLKSPTSTKDSKSGSCHDQVVLEVDALKSMGLNPKATFFMEYKDGEAKGGTTHSFAHFDKDGKTYWLENSLEGQKGLHEFENLEAVKSKIKELHDGKHVGDSSKFPNLEFAAFDTDKHVEGESLEELVDTVYKNASEADSLEKEASTAWKRTLGDLGEESISKIKDLGLMDPRKHMDGLERGNKNLLESIGIKDLSDSRLLAALEKAKISRGIDKKLGKGNGARMLSNFDDNFSFSPRMITGIKGFNKPVISMKGDSSLMSILEKSPNYNAGDFLKARDMASKADLEDVRTILKRHEIDEIRSIERLGKKNQLLDHPLGHGLKYSPEMNFGHTSPEVMIRESRNVTFAPEGSKRYMTELRRMSGEIDSQGKIYGEGFDAIRDAIPKAKSLNLNGNNYGKSGVFEKDKSRVLGKNLREAVALSKQASEDSLEKLAEELIEKKIVTQDDLYTVARIVHEINRHYNKLLMDREDPSWDELDEKDKANRIALLSATVPDIKTISAKKMHDMWVDQQAKEGWVYGESYDSKKKTHPCIVSWKELPDLEKAKDAMYLAVIKAMTELHFGIDKTIDAKIKEVKIPGGEKVLMNKSATLFGQALEKQAGARRDALVALSKSPTDEINDKILFNGIDEGEYEDQDAVGDLNDKIYQGLRNQIKQNPSAQKLVDARSAAGSSVITPLMAGAIGGGIAGHIGGKKLGHKMIDAATGINAKTKLGKAGKAAAVVGAGAGRVGTDIAGTLLGSTAAGLGGGFLGNYLSPYAYKNVTQADIDAYNAEVQKFRENELPALVEQSGGTLKKSATMFGELLEKQAREKINSLTEEEAWESYITDVKQNDPEFATFTKDQYNTPEWHAVVNRVNKGFYDKHPQFKSVEKQAKESTHLQDFVAGIDPTGVSTFRNAMGNEENHGTHKLVGNAGGFIGGGLMGAALPAALTGAASLGVKRFNPALSKELSIMAKGSMEAYNPKKVKKYLASFKELPNLKNGGRKLMRASEDVMKNVDGVKNVNNLDDLANLNVGKMKDSYSELEGAHKSMKNLNKKMSEKYYDGKSADEGLSRAMAAVTGLGMAGVTGGLNAASANLQYNTALKEKAKTATLFGTLLEKQASELGKRSLQQTNNIRMSAEAGRMLELKYKDKSGNVSTRFVEPYKLTDDDFWGYDPEKGGIRRFKIKNIKAVKKTTKAFTPQWPIETSPIQKAAMATAVQKRYNENRLSDEDAKRAFKSVRAESQIHDSINSKTKRIDEIAAVKQSRYDEAKRLEIEDFNKKNEIRKLWGMDPIEPTPVSEKPFNAMNEATKDMSAEKYKRLTKPNNIRHMPSIDPKRQSHYIGRKSNEVIGKIRSRYGEDAVKVNRVDDMITSGIKVSLRRDQNGKMIPEYILNLPNSNSKTVRGKPIKSNRFAKELRAKITAHETLGELSNMENIIAALEKKKLLDGNSASALQFGTHAGPVPVHVDAKFGRAFQPATDQFFTDMRKGPGSLVSMNGSISSQFDFLKDVYNRPDAKTLKDLVAKNPEQLRQAAMIIAESNKGAHGVPMDEMNKIIKAIIRKV